MKETLNEIQEARALLKESEDSNDPLKKARLLEEGLNLLENCKEHMNLSEDEKRLISNVRISHTRSLLNQFLAMKDVDFGLWSEYMNMIDLRLDDERKKLFQEDPGLEENYKEFLELWLEERTKIRREVLKEFQREYKKSREP